MSQPPAQGLSAPPDLPYRSPAAFARTCFGGAVFRVVVDAGFSCPARDGTHGTGGCLFCSIDGFRPPTSRPQLSLREQIRRARPRLEARYPGAVGYLVYFQPYTNTYGDPQRLAALLIEAQRTPGALGVVIGTRPDALAPDALCVLETAAQRGFLEVELGVQSTDDAVLAAMERHHTWEDSRRAIGALRARRIRVGAHVILGTPWEAPASQVRGAARLSAAGIDAVKLHHLQVLRGSRLATQWPQPGARLPSWREYASLAADFLEQLAPHIVVDRLLARAPRDLLIAPRWEVSAATVRAEICRRLRSRGSRQGRTWRGPRGRAAGGATGSR